MRKTTLIAGVILSASLLITGCSNNSESPDKDTTSQSEVSESETAEVSKAVNDYYTALIQKSGDSLEVSNDVETVIRETTDDKTYEAFSSTNNPFTAFDNISDEQAKELADRIEELNPVAEQFDYSDMNDKDRAVLNLLNIASSIMLTSIQDKTIEISIPAEAISVEKNTATVSYSSMSFIIDGSETTMSDALGGTNFHAIKKDGVWKVDGQKTYESTKEAALANSASDNGGSDNGEG